MRIASPLVIAAPLRKTMQTELLLADHTKEDRPQ